MFQWTLKSKNLSLESKLDKQFGPLMVFGCHGNLGNAFLDYLCEAVYSQIPTPLSKITIAVTSDECSQMQSMVDCYADDDVEFWTFDPDDSGQIQSLISNQKQFIFLPSSSCDRLVQFKNIAQVIERSGQPDAHVTLVTSILAPESEAKWMIDYCEMSELLTKSKLKSTHIQCSPFMEFLFAFAPDIQLGDLPLPIGNSKFAPVAVDDVAKVCVDSLLDEEHRSTINICGPNMVGGEEIAKTATSVLKYKVKFIPDVTEADVRKKLQARSVSDYLADGMLQYFQLIKLGHLEWVSSLNEILMNESVALDEFFARNQDRFNQIPSAATSVGTSNGTSSEPEQMVPQQMQPLYIEKVPETMLKTEFVATNTYPRYN